MADLDDVLLLLAAILGGVSVLLVAVTSLEKWVNQPDRTGRR